MNDPRDLIVLLVFQPWTWVGVALGLGGAWLAWNYLPATSDRASAAAIIFIIGCALGVYLGTLADEKK